MSATERRKGANYEREVGRRLQDVLGVEAARTAPLQAGRCDAAPDVAVRGLWIECKRRKRIAACSWLDKTDEEAPFPEIPIVVMREDAGESVVMVNLKDLAMLVALLRDTPAVVRLMQAST